MKSLLHDAGSKPRPKRSVQDHPAKYWGTGMHTAVGSPMRKVRRSDGSVSIDKTAGMKSRPHKKQQLRNANRSITKAARQKLKKQLQEEVQEIVSTVEPVTPPKVEPEIKTPNKPLGFIAATKEITKFVFGFLFSPDSPDCGFGTKLKFIFALLGHILNPFK